MIVEIQFSRSDQTMYAMNQDYETVASWECHDDFVEGYNEFGEPRASLPNGFYDGPNGEGVVAEITEGMYGPSYGTFYITTGDHRGRDIHGGGAGLDDPYAPYQGWVPTYGCLRMQNVDGEQLAHLIEASEKVVLTVVD